MTNNNTTAETTATVTVEDIISELVTAAFGTNETVTGYMIAKVINGVFTATGTDKVIPTQMMYNYSKNGLINKVKGCKAFTKDEVTAFVTKYTAKHITK